MHNSTSAHRRRAANSGLDVPVSSNSKRWRGNGSRSRVSLVVGNQRSSGVLLRDEFRTKITAEDYEIYLDSDHWKMVRRDYTQSGLPQECFVCQDSKFELHHLNYKNLGAETWDDLVPLCRKHHQAAHKLVKSGAPLSEAHSFLLVKIYSVAD